MRDCSAGRVHWGNRQKRPGRSLAPRGAAGALMVLVLKLKLVGRNALFCVRSSVHFNGSLIVGVMSGTALYVDALPPPPVVRS